MHKEPFATLTFNERKHGKNSIFLSAVTSENRCNQRFKLFERNLQKKNYCERASRGIRPLNKNLSIMRLAKSDPGK